MIVSLTVNPAVDQTVWVEQLQPGTVLRVNKTLLDPAGKGINVSRMAHRLGHPTIAFGFLAGETGRIVERALQSEGVQHEFVGVAGQTRVNVTIVDGQGVATSLLGAGPTVTPEALSMLVGMIRVWLQGGGLLVVAGTIAPGIPEDSYRGIIESAHRFKVKVILDTHGAPLRHGVAAGPDMVKPNLAEAEELLGRKLPDLSAVVAGAKEIAGRGVGIVVISMGAKGAICFEGGRVWHAVPPKVDAQGTVGSGDSMVAGLAVALARGEPIEEGLRLGTAAGAATAISEGTALGTAAGVAAQKRGVRLERLE